MVIIILEDDAQSKNERVNSRGICFMPLFVAVNAGKRLDYIDNREVFVENQDTYWIHIKWEILGELIELVEPWKDKHF